MRAEILAHHSSPSSTAAVSVQNFVTFTAPCILETVKLSDLPFLAAT